jgi:hypothetical protein
MKRVIVITAALMLIPFAQTQNIVPAQNAVPTATVQPGASIATPNRENWPGVVDVYGGYFHTEFISSGKSWERFSSLPYGCSGPSCES